MRSHRGQATVEYVAALALLVCVFAGAAVAVAAPEIPRAVVGKLKLALCVVGGDVCTSQDAAARGLDPCLLDGEEHLSGNGVSLLFFHTGGTDSWAIERRSDGTVTLTQAYGQSLQASTGVGLELGPVAVGGSASAGPAFTRGRSWTMTEARLREALGRMKGDPGENRLVLPLLLGAPDASYTEGGTTASAELAAQAVKSLPAGGGEARSVLGRRKDGHGTSYYLDLGGAPTGPLTEALGVDVSGHVVAEYRAAEPPVLTLRATGRSGAEETQTVLRLPLRTQSDRAAARRVAFLDLHDPTLPIRDLIGRIRARGTVERLRYRTEEDDHSWAYGGKLGVELGVDHASSVLRRRLIEATVRDGPSLALRADCLPGA